VVRTPRLRGPRRSLAGGFGFRERVRAGATASPLCHGPSSFRIFADLCTASRARGKLVADAYHAALAIEHGCELVTADADFARFPKLRWRHPFAA